MGSPVVLDIVVGPPREASSYGGPSACMSTSSKFSGTFRGKINHRSPVSPRGMQLEDDALFLGSYLPSLQVRPQVVHPPKSATLSAPPQSYDTNRAVTGDGSGAAVGAVRYLLT